jgi:hypothetical protein
VTHGAADISTRHQGVDFLVGREAAERLFGEPQLAIDSDLEHAAARADEFDVNIGQFSQSFPRTEGFRLVASTAAVVDDDFHRSGSWSDKIIVVLSVGG